jgi:hypothetical protein
MQTNERKSFTPEPCDAPAEIDYLDQEQLRYWAERLEATPAEVVEAVRTVGPNCTAVAIWLGSADAV